MVGLKRSAKAVLQSSVARLAPYAWGWSSTPTLLVIMYHRVLPAGHKARELEQPGMFVSPETLTMHIDVLRESFTLVHIEDWLARVAAGASVPRRACALTFDDGWRDNHDYGFPVLRSKSAPATVYLVTDLVGTRYSFWPNTLARILREGDAAVIDALPRWLQETLRTTGAGGDQSADVARLDAVICACKARHSDAEMSSALAGVPSGIGSDRDLMDWHEIRQWHSSGLVRVGSHTRRHTRLSKVESADQLQDEVLGSLAAIQDRLGVVPETFCYPNGDFSPSAVALVREYFKGAVTTQRGWNTVRADNCLLRRVGVHEDVSSTRAAFLARIAGVG